MLATGSNSLAGYRLSIRFGADGFSFSVLGTLDGSVVQTDRYPVPTPSAVADVLRQALRKPYLMDYRFQSVEFAVETQTTIVPLEHFNKSDMLAFYRLCFPTWQSSVADMQYQILSSLEAVMIFCLDSDVLQVVRECYPDVKVCCTDALLLERFAAQQEKRPAPEDAEGQDVYVSFADRRFFVAVFFSGTSTCSRASTGSASFTSNRNRARAGDTSTMSPLFPSIRFCRSSFTFIRW